MNKIFNSPKMTAILGLIGGILMLPSLFILTTTIQDFFMYFYGIGLTIYFVIVLMRIYDQKGNIKIANYILIASFSIPFLIGIPFIIGKLNINVIIYLFVYGIITIYMTSILLRKGNFINNKFFAITVILYVLYQLIRLQGYASTFIGLKYSVEIELLAEILRYVGYLLIIPYFYQYYKLLKGDNKNGK